MLRFAFEIITKNIVINREIHKFAVMTEKLLGIVLDITRHSDRHSIVTLFTRSRGRVSFLFPMGSGKSGRLRQARIQPMAIIEADVNFKGSAELQRLGSFAPADVLTDVYFNPVKRMMTLFLSEFLNRLLRATMPDPNIWDYVAGSIRLLDRMREGVSDFHIVFLSSLLPFAGIQPDSSDYEPGMVFDMQAGRFVDRIPPHSDYLSGDEARFAAILNRVTFSNVRALKLNGNLRNRILQNLLHYYAIHYPGTSNLKSLAVLHDVFTT